MIVTFIFKNGYKMTTKCEKITLNHSPVDNSLQGFQMTDVTGQTPLYVDLDQILCIIKED